MNVNETHYQEAVEHAESYACWFSGLVSFSRRVTSEPRKIRWFSL